MDLLDKRHKRKKMDMRFGTWKSRSMYRAASDLRKIGWGGMDWIDLAQDRD
jgi:hypothetical protein